MSAAAFTRRDARQAARAEARALRPVRRGSGRGRALLRRAAWVALIAGSLSAVVWRQTVAHERQQELRAVRAELDVAEAERVDLVNRVQALRSRARVVRVARERLGMHLPADDEIVLLPLPADAAPAGGAGAAAEDAP